MSFIQFATALVGLMGAALLVYEVWRACKSHAAPGEDEHATQHHSPGLPHHRRKK